MSDTEVKYNIILINILSVRTRFNLLIPFTINNDISGQKYVLIQTGDIIACVYNPCYMMMVIPIIIYVFITVIRHVGSPIQYVTIF